MSSSEFSEISDRSEVCPKCGKTVFPIIKGVTFDCETLEHSHTCPECKYVIWGGDGGCVLPLVIAAAVVVGLLLVVVTR